MMRIGRSAAYAPVRKRLRPMCACRSRGWPNASPKRRPMPRRPGSWRRSSAMSATAISIVTPLIDINDSDEMKKVTLFLERLAERALRMEGTCTGEHGVGQGKIKYLLAEHGAGDDRRHARDQADARSAQHHESRARCCRRGEHLHRHPGSSSALILRSGPFRATPQDEGERRRRDTPPDTDLPLKRANVTGACGTGCDYLAAVRWRFCETAGRGPNWPGSGYRAKLDRFPRSFHESADFSRRLSGYRRADDSAWFCDRAHPGVAGGAGWAAFHRLEQLPPALRGGGEPPCRPAGAGRRRDRCAHPPDADARSHRRRDRAARRRCRCAPVRLASNSRSVRWCAASCARRRPASPARSSPSRSAPTAAPRCPPADWDSMPARWRSTICMSRTRG